MVREAKNGQSFFLASSKFEQDICSVWSMEQTWKANDKPVVQLFLHGPADFTKFTTAIHYQMSRYTTPHKTPECIRLNRLQVVLFGNHATAGSSKSRSIAQEMDLVYAFQIVTLEHSFYVCELVHPLRNSGSTSSTSRPRAAPRSTTNTNSSSTSCENFETAPTDAESLPTNTSLETAMAETAPPDTRTSCLVVEEDPLQLFDNLTPLDENTLGETDPEYEAFLSLLNE